MAGDAAHAHGGSAAIETDYLVIGAGASGMAFVDALICESDADVVLVDRRHRPGGHWTDAYPFVRLHQPSACYGVNSRRLGADRIDETGPNAGFYERATAAEICGYYQQVLDEQLLASGRVRFFGMHDHVGELAGEHRMVSRLTGEETRVRVRRKVVDATYLETAVPSTHTPSFSIDPGVGVCTPNDLVGLSDPGTGYTVFGAGKTAMDTCSWLLEEGVPAEAIRWVRPRDAWVLDRASLQPLELVTSVVEWMSFVLQSAAQAVGAEDLFRRLEACGVTHRLDPEVEPTVFRGATLSEAEREGLRRITNVVRRGRVVHVGVDRITLEEGSIPTDRGQVHVDCTAAGLRLAPARPIFEPHRITVQTVRFGFLPFNAALLGFLEASGRDDGEKNRLSPPNPFPDAAGDFVPGIYTSTRADILWSEEPDVDAWVGRSRLNVALGLHDHLHEPRMQSAITGVFENREPALRNLERLLPTDGLERARSSA